ncbi:hypothetical protein GPALN_007468 [Globodera pallida]|nr:hypothetical protein GPALN_007468 [Globodera pallida]
MCLLTLCLLFILLLGESAVLEGSPTDKKHWSDCKFKNGLLQLGNGKSHFICYESKLGTKFGTSSKVGRRFNVKKGNGRIVDECPRGADGFQSWHAIRITEQSDGKVKSEASFSMELNGEDFGIITNESKQLNLTNALANYRQFGGEFQRALTLGAFMDNYRIASGLIAMEIFLSANKNGTKRCKSQMPPSPPVFKGWNLLNSSEQRPECARVFLNDSNYTAQIGKRRLTFEDPVWLEMDCANGIRKRNYFPGKEGFEDAAFPLAQVRIVYKDYVFLEKELASSYSPNNWYCFSVDHKSDKQFRMRLNQLSECLPNVVVSTREWVIAGGGHNMTRAFLDCLNLLTVPEKQWEYVALLQVRRAGGRTKQRMNDRIKNHDVAIKTNREMVQIYRWLNGANDVEVITGFKVAGTGLTGTGWRDGTGMTDRAGREDGAGRDGAGWPERDFDYPIEVTWLPGGRVNESLDWSFEAIRLFRNASRNVLDVEGFPPKLVLSKGYVASSLSRKMAEFIVYELDLTETVRRLESGVNFGIDEILMPTLHAADALRAPGGAAIWYDVKKCGSGHMRHAVCLFGMEDLADKMAVWPHLFANKLMPEFDFGALLCWWEKMHQRAYIETRQRSLSRLNSAFYADLPHVRFQKFAADLKKLNDAQRGTKDIIPFRKALAFFNCRTDEFNMKGSRRPSVLLIYCFLCALVLFYLSKKNVNMPSSAPLLFKGWDILKSSEQRPECARVFLNDSNYTAQIGKRRLTFEDPMSLEMDCANGIRKRNYFPGKEGFEDAEFPLAQVRVVYKDYVFLEKELASSYSPNNWYCYSVDHKSDKQFHMRLKQLSECLPNVVVSTCEWNVDSAGHNMTRAFLDCLHLLTVPEKRWEYVAILQNYDVAIKTNREMVQIYRWLNGANDVEVTWPPKGRVNESLDWSFEAIRLFRNESRNVLDVEGFPPKLVISKGYVASSLSRKMAEFILYELDLTETVRRLESGGYGIDEILVPTLNAADALRAPGGFTRDCLERKKGQARVQHITRAAIWLDVKKCGSGYLRHTVCILGMEDLADKMAVWPHLFANKLMPEFDFGALLCWWEKMHQRAYIETRQRSLSRLNSAFYADLPHVRFQKFAADLKKLNDAQRGTKDVIPFRKALEFFNCSTDKFNVN